MATNPKYMIQNMNGSADLTGAGTVGGTGTGTGDGNKPVAGTGAGNRMKSQFYYLIINYLLLYQFQTKPLSQI